MLHNKQEIVTKHTIFCLIFCKKTKKIIKIHFFFKKIDNKFVFLKKNHYICAKISLKIMSVNFKHLIAQLRELTAQLQKRCQEAEAKVKDLNYVLEEKDKEIATLNRRNAELVMRYENVKAGLAGKGSGDIDGVKEQYRQLIREVDACIDMLQHAK